jgi:arylsulfatase A-like enzyme
VLIYADDIGYGDLSCYGATAVKTTNPDRLARQGVRFTDARSSLATCTPSRESMLTGAYAWRSKGADVPSCDARLILGPRRLNWPEMMRRTGYRTGVMGKRHPGLGEGNVDCNSENKARPLELGFASSLLMPGGGTDYQLHRRSDDAGGNNDPATAMPDTIKELRSQPDPVRAAR